MSLVNLVSRYCVALAAVGTAVAIRWVLDPVLHDLAPLITAYAAVAFVVWACGWHAAAFAAVASYLACEFFFIEPRGTFEIEGARGWAVAAAFGMSTAMIIVLGEAMRRAQARSTAAAQAATDSEAALRIKSRQLATYLETAAIAMRRVSPDGTILWANEAELKLFGYAEDEYVGRNIKELCVDREAIEDILARLYRGEEIVESELQVKCKDGSIRVVLVDSSVMREDGRFVHTQCFSRDVTERRQVEQVRARLAAIIESSNDAIISKDLDGKIVSWNSGAQRVFGYTPDEAIGKPITMLIPPGRFDEAPSILSRIRRGERVTHYETVRRRKDGSLVDISLTVSPIVDGSGAIVGASKIARDITERNRARQAVLDSEHRLRMITDAAPALISYVDAEFRYRFTNKGYEDWFGLSAGDIQGQHMRDVLGDAAFERIEPMVRAALAGERVQFDSEVPYRTGGTRVIHGEYVPDTKADGTVAGFYALVVDITRRKHAEDLVAMRARQQHALARIGEHALSQRELQDVFDHATALVAQTLNVEYCKVLECMPDGKHVLLRSGVGWKPGLVGTARVSTDLDSQAGYTLHADGPIVVNDMREETRFSGPPLLLEHGVISGMSCIIRQPNGRAWGVLGTHAKRRVNFTPDDMSFLIAVASTLGSAIDRKHAEYQLARHAEDLAEAVRRTKEELLELHERQRTSERFVAMGALAAGLGHDMSNLLLPIQARLELLRSEISTERSRESVDAIEASVAYLRNLARSLRLLARDASTAPADSMTDLAKWWTEAQPLFKAVVPRSVQLQADIGRSCVVRASPHQLTQLVYNLIQNAGEALKGIAHGIVSFTAKFHDADTVAADALVGTTSMVKLSVSDNGPGMTDEVKRRCMEPFFSTKQKSLSGGMGLALVRSIVDATRGRIEVQSVEGQGTTFVVYLPASPVNAVGNGHGAQELCTVAIAIADTRIRAMVDWLLRAEGVASIEAVGTPHDGVSIWVVDGERAPEALQYARENETRSIVILADQPDQCVPANVLYLGSRPTPNELRLAIAKALSNSLQAELSQ